MKFFSFLSTVMRKLEDLDVSVIPVIPTLAQNRHIVVVTAISKWHKEKPKLLSFPSNHFCSPG
jgi:hypothetical protein